MIARDGGHTLDREMQLKGEPEPQGVRKRGQLAEVAVVGGQFLDGTPQRKYLVRVIWEEQSKNKVGQTADNREQRYLQNSALKCRASRDSWSVGCRQACRLHPSM